MKLKDLDMGIRETIDVLLLDVTERETKNKKPYTVLTVTDGEMTVDVKKWDSVLVDFEGLKNTVISVSIKSSMYGSEITYDTDVVVKSYKPVSDFIPKVPLDSKEMMKEIESFVLSIKSLSVRSMVLDILNDNLDKLLYWAAAKGMHHAVYGGLLYHMYRMCKNAVEQCKIYTSLNSDLLIAGTLLHDIGKLKELETSSLGKADYTMEGSLLGHAYIGMSMIQEYGTKHNVSDDEILQLQHMIASHHGNLEWGAITVPQTIEAKMLHYLDMIDSNMYMFEDTFKTMEPNHPSAKVFGLGTSIYKF